MLLWSTLSDSMVISNWVCGTLHANGEIGSLEAKPMADLVGRFGGKMVIPCHDDIQILTMLNLYDQ